VTKLTAEEQDDNVVCLAAWREKKAVEFRSLKSGSAVSRSSRLVAGGQMDTTVLELVNRFPFCASVEVNDLHWVRAHFSSRWRSEVVASVKKILSQEFGSKRVTRTGFQFAIRHRDAELLISSLLRVQFYTNQIILPEYNLHGERVEQNGMSITWGVGRTWRQAQQDRVRKVKARLPGSLLSKDP